MLEIFLIVVMSFLFTVSLIVLFVLREVERDLDELKLLIDELKE